MKYNFCFCANDKYAMQTGVTIVSIMQNVSKGQDVDIYILNEDFTKYNVECFRQIEDMYENLHIIIVPFSDKLSRIANAQVLKGQPPKGAEHYFYALGAEAYTRLFISQILPVDVDYVVYLDSDIVVNGNIGSIYEYKSETGIAAVVDIWPQSYNEKISFGMNETYYSGAVQLLNLNYWREHGWGERVVDFINSMNTPYRLFDQDIMNVLFSRKILKLPLYYNDMYITRRFSVEQILDFCQKEELNYYSRSEIKDAKKKQIVIHYAGDQLGKPWQIPFADKESKIWYSYYKLTPWSKDGLKKNLGYNTKSYAVFMIKKLLRKVQYTIIGRNIQYKKIKDRFYKDVAEQSIVNNGR